MMNQIQKEYWDSTQKPVIIAILIVVMLFLAFLGAACVI